MTHHDDMTYHGLCDHTKHLIEKFGHMVILHHHHDGKHRGSLLCYAGAIYRHVKALEHALTEFRESSSKHRDIKIMHHKLRALWNVALKHFALEAREVMEDLGEEIVEAAQEMAAVVQASPEYNRLREAFIGSGSGRSGRDSTLGRDSVLGRMSGTSDGAGSPARARSPTRSAAAAALVSTGAARSGSRASGSRASGSGSRASGSGSRSMSDRVVRDDSEDDDIAEILNGARSGSPTRNSVSQYLPSRVNGMTV